jgi:hypothetical protein
MAATAIRLGAIRRHSASLSNRTLGIGVGTPIPQLAELQAITGLIDADLGNGLRNPRIAIHQGACTIEVR